MQRGFLDERMSAKDAVKTESSTFIAGGALKKKKK